jgi:hypothetical protein
VTVIAPAKAGRNGGEAKEHRDGEALHHQRVRQTNTLMRIQTPGVGGGGSRGEGGVDCRD